MCFPKCKTIQTNYIFILWPDGKMTGTLGSLMQPLSMVTTVRTDVSLQWRSVMEQLVPLEVQLCTCSFRAVATYMSAFRAGSQLTWPTLPRHCRDTWTLVGGQGPVRKKGQRKFKLSKHVGNIQRTRTKGKYINLQLRATLVIFYPYEIIALNHILINTKMYKR